VALRKRYEGGRKGMNKLQKKLLLSVSRLAEREAQVTLSKNKGPCIGYFYQPKRPKTK